jgi:hypothetical protein
VDKNKERFDLWFVKPLRELEAIHGGAGAFIALATSCFLYERYIRAKSFAETGRRFDKKLDEKYRNLQLIQDFKINAETARAFWNVMRDGLLHYGMPKHLKGTKKLPKWRFDGDYLQPITLSHYPSGDWWLEVQPWKVMDIVIKRCQDNMDLIIGSNEFPWATIEEENEV